MAPNNESGTDLVPAEEGIMREVEVEEGVVITTEEDKTEISGDHAGEASEAIGGSSDRDGGNPHNPNLDNVPQIDQVGTENGLGNGGGTTGTPHP